MYSSTQCVCKPDCNTLHHIHRSRSPQYSTDKYLSTQWAPSARTLHYTSSMCTKMPGGLNKPLIPCQCQGSLSTTKSATNHETVRHAPFWFMQLSCSCTACAAIHCANTGVRCRPIPKTSPRAFQCTSRYRMAKTHRMPYPYRSFSTKGPYNSALFRKMTCHLRHPMSLCRPVQHIFISTQWGPSVPTLHHTCTTLQLSATHA